MQVSPLTALFLDAVAVDAPSLRESPMGAFVRRALTGTPVRIVEDDAGKAIGGTCGNLICIPPTYVSGRPTVGLFAHLDTPGSTAGVRPVLTEDRITSDGSTMLGVDNRAGVSVLLDLLRDSGLFRGRSWPHGKPAPAHSMQASITQELH